MNSATHNFILKQQLREDIKSIIHNNKCNIDKFLTNVNVIPYKEDKENQSNTIIIFANILLPIELAKKYISLNKAIVIKCSFEDQLVNNLEVETAVYENIIDKLVSNNNCPFLINFYGAYKCNIGNNTLFNNVLIKDEINKYIKAYATKKNNLNLLFLERSYDKTFYGFDFTQIHEFNDYISIIFQLLYTLTCFERENVRHNDLHGNNIFIKELDEYVDLYFQPSSEDVYIKIKTKYIVDLYDFDRATVRYNLSIPRNNFLDDFYCKNYGTCNLLNNKYDLFTIIFNIKESMIPRMTDKKSANIISSFIDLIVDPIFYNKNTRVDVNGEITIRNLLAVDVYPTDKELMLPSDALNFLVNKDFGIKTSFEIYDVKPSINNSLIFYTPKVIEKHHWYPVSMETHKPLFNENIDLVNVIDPKIIIDALTFVSKDTNYGEYLYHWSNEMIQINYLETWAINLKKIIIEFLKIKNIRHVYSIPYVVAFIIITCPVYYTLKSSRETILGSIDDYFRNSFYDENELDLSILPSLEELIDDIWNTFNNRLPIELPIV